MEGKIEGRLPSETSPEAQDPSITVSLNELEDELLLTNQLSSIASSTDEDHLNEVEFRYVLNAWMNERDDDKTALFHRGEQKWVNRSSEAEESFVECT
jgi:hypothetical protein